MQRCANHTWSPNMRPALLAPCRGFAPALVGCTPITHWWGAQAFILIAHLRLCAGIDSRSCGKRYTLQQNFEVRVIENIPPLEIPERPVEIGYIHLWSLIFMVVCIGIGIWFHPILEERANYYRHRANVVSNITLRGPAVSSFTVSVEDENMKLVHPLSGVYRMTDWKAMHADHEDGLELLRENSWASKLMKDYPDAKNLGTLLALLERSGQRANSFRIAELAAAQLEGREFEYGFLPGWVSECCADSAAAYFERREYFLGLDAVRRGLRLIRLAPLQNRAGADSRLLDIASPLIIADAFLPDNLDTAVDDVDYSTIGKLILEKEFGKLGDMSSDHPMSGLAAYARGVVHLNEQQWDDADQQFSLAAGAAVKSEAADLARFMGVRTRYWAMHFAVERLRTPVQVKDNTGEASEPASISGDFTEESTTNGLDVKQAQLLSRIFIEELVRAGVLQRKKPELKLTQPPKNGRQYRDPNQRIIKAQCALGRESLSELIGLIQTRHWLRQAAEYRDALEAECGRF